MWRISTMTLWHVFQIDYSITLLYSHLQERQKRYAKFAEQIQKVNEMHSALNKIKMNIEQIVPLMDRLNSVLPTEEQLPPLELGSNYNYLL